MSASELINLVLPRERLGAIDRKTKQPKKLKMVKGFGLKFAKQDLTHTHTHKA